MASTDRVIELARELSDAFETRYRDDTRNETAYKTLHEGSPEWMTDVCRAAHDAAAMLPDDTRYVFIEDAADAIAEEPTDPDCDAEEHDWSETRDGMSEPDIYTNDLTRWLASRVDRYAYCDDALDEYGSGSLAHLEGGPTLALIRLGQSAEKAEVFDQVLAALIAHADAEADAHETAMFERASDEVARTFGERNQPCAYGHVDCSDVAGGRCFNETVNRLMAETEIGAHKLT